MESKTRDTSARKRSLNSRPSLQSTAERRGPGVRKAGKDSNIAPRRQVLKQERTDNQSELVESGAIDVWDDELMSELDGATQGPVSGRGPQERKWDDTGSEVEGPEVGDEDEVCV
jgi:hypothetical protein